MRMKIDSSRHNYSAFEVNHLSTWRNGFYNFPISDANVLDFSIDFIERVEHKTILEK
jgi:hypothetical protein